jgi:hypothetical protein
LNSVLFVLLLPVTMSYPCCGSSNLLAKSHCHQAFRNAHAPRSNHETNRPVGNRQLILLPLPCFPPPLDFDASQVELPPSYAEAIDVEKAIHPVRSNRRRFGDLSTLCPGQHSTKHPRPTFPALQKKFETPIGRHVRIYRCLRYSVLNAYRRIFTFVIVLNVIGALIILQRNRWRFDGNKSLSILTTLSSSNLLLSILTRQDYLINLLFRTAWLVPWSTPLWFRRCVARVYCYGGIHSGAAVAGTMWWAMFTAVMSWTFTKEAETFSTIAVAWVLLLLLLIIVVLAYPALRARYHNTFEMTHRFFGWLAVAIFWVQLLLLARHTSSRSTPRRGIGQVLMHDPVSSNPSHVHKARIAYLLSNHDLLARLC